MTWVVHQGIIVNILFWSKLFKCLSHVIECRFFEIKETVNVPGPPSTRTGPGARSTWPGFSSTGTHITRRCGKRDKLNNAEQQNSHERVKKSHRHNHTRRPGTHYRTQPSTHQTRSSTSPSTRLGTPASFTIIRTIPGNNCPSGQDRSTPDTECRCFNEWKEMQRRSHRYKKSSL